MKCVSCGITYLEGAKHCHNCGAAISTEQSIPHAKEIAAAVEQPISQYTPQDYGQVPPTGYTQSPPQGDFQQPGGYPAQHINAPVNNHMQAVKQYFEYVLEIIKKPHSVAFSKDRNHLLFGIINIIAFAVLFGLTIWVVLGRFADVTFLGKGRSLSIFSAFIEPIVIAAIVLGIGGCVTSGLLYINKRQVDFLEVLSKWFAYMALPAVVMPVIFLATVVHLYSFALLLFGVAIILIFASAASIVQNYKLEEDGKIGFTYNIAIFFAINGVVMYLVINRIINTITSYISSLFGGLFSPW